MPLLSERRVVFVVGAVQFVNILDFTMVMPLGPDFARALGVPASEMGLITSGYTAAAAVVGFLGSFFLDRFDRRRALAVAMLGLGLGTAAGGLATDLGPLIAARVLAGLFGGPATSIAFSIVADVIPQERRGRAMGAVAGALSVAQVAGIPLALWLARTGGWRLPFFALAALGLLVTVGAVTLLPPLRSHLDSRDPREAPFAATWALLARPLVMASYAMTAVVMGAGFLVLPNLPAWLQGNLHYPRDRFEYLYAAGGTATFVTNRLVGRLVDRWGSFRVGTAAAALILATMYLLLVKPPAGLPVMPTFVLFAIALGARNVAYNSLTTRVPQPHERARFLSLQSTVYHVASSLGAGSSARLLGERPDHALVGMTRVAAVSMALTALFPLIARTVQRRVDREPRPARA